MSWFKAPKPGPVRKKIALWERRAFTSLLPQQELQEGRETPTPAKQSKYQVPVIFYWMLILN